MKGHIEATINRWPAEKIENFIIGVEMDIARQKQIDAPVEHTFSEGVYARTVTMPADAFFVGKIHKYRNLNIVLEGEIIVISKDGAKRMKAGDVVVSSPGVKRLVYTITPVKWMTVHGTHETDVEKIEDQMIAKSFEEVVPWLG